ncbi:lysR-family transcriptional regulatory protein, partial [Yersinia pestis PY-59]
MSNVINIYYDWGKSENLTQLYKIAEKNNIQANIIKFYYENIDEIGDYDGNSLILSSEKIASERFMLLNEVQDI